MAERLHLFEMRRYWRALPVHQTHVCRLAVSSLSHQRVTNGALSCYVKESHVASLAEKVGFEFADKSEINTNPKDTTQHPEGVWSLPPSLQLKNQERDKYLLIGESDRMTLKFLKPNDEKIAK